MYKLCFARVIPTYTARTISGSLEFAVFPMKRYTDEQKAQIVAEFKDAGLEI